MHKLEAATRNLLVAIKHAHDLLNEFPLEWDNAEKVDVHTHHIFTKVFADVADAYGRMSSYVHLCYDDDSVQDDMFDASIVAEYEQMEQSARLNEVVDSYTVENGRTHGRVSTRVSELTEELK